MLARRVALVSDCKSETYAPTPIYNHTECVWQLLKGLNTLYPKETSLYLVNAHI